ncbi:MAG: YkgJ family cysteine cluster protein [Simkaniaceae bacterium]|nr:YkgJ family cysteine cluster protein [Simkaniaceae bacterium]
MTNKLNLWYKGGLAFKCTGCGKCCTGAPGYVFLTEEDIETLAKHFNISNLDFLKKYTRQIGHQISLLEDPKNYDCTLLKEGKFCSAYSARPVQCRTFPFWEENLKSPKAWEELKNSCEGLTQIDAPTIAFEEIQKTLDTD